ncbi:hypothetical protein IAT38_007131 [Cryptococcus sp. DSM 104549]
MTSSTTFPLILEPSDLPQLPSTSLILLDATYLHLPSPPTRDPRSEYLQRRLPGARFWSLKDVSDPHELGFKLMFPSAERFAKQAGELGIEKDSWVVVYDTEGAFSAPRTVFTFLAYGHERVSLLNGGLPAAVDAGIELETGDPTHSTQPTSYPIPNLHLDWIASYADIRKTSTTPQASAERVIVDARNTSNFVAGHIPRSFSLPWRDLLVSVPRKREGVRVTGEGDTYHRLPREGEVRQKLDEALGEEKAAGVWSGETKVINSCGGGLSAAILWLSLWRLGIHSELYDEVRVSPAQYLVEV